MISYEYKGRIAISLICIWNHRDYKDMNKKKDNNTRVNREKLQLLATCPVSIEHLINNMKHPVSERANSGSSEAT